MSVFNQLFIERTQYTGQQSSCPTSLARSFKGAIRTAIAGRPEPGSTRPPTKKKFSYKVRRKSDHCNGKTPAATVTLQTSPLRLLKIADLMPAPQREPDRRVSCLPST
jgi:hypothetical protein